MHMMRLEFALIIHLINWRLLHLWGAQFNRINIRVLIVYLYMIVAAIAHLGLDELLALLIDLMLFFQILKYS